MWAKIKRIHCVYIHIFLNKKETFFKVVYSEKSVFKNFRNCAHTCLSGQIGMVAAMVANLSLPTPSSSGRLLPNKTFTSISSAKDHYLIIPHKTHFFFLHLTNSPSRVRFVPSSQVSQSGKQLVVPISVPLQHFHKHNCFTYMMANPT